MGGLQVSDLKNCPFCGAPASQDTEGFTFCSENCVYVDCGKSAWNRRAASPAVKALMNVARSSIDWLAFEGNESGRRIMAEKLYNALTAVEKEIQP